MAEATEQEYSLEDQESGFSALLEEAKRKGYLLQEDLFNLLTPNLTDSNQIEGIIKRLESSGITVFLTRPDENSLMLEKDTSEEEMIEAIEVLASEARTTDPVRMYMREMGSVELLTREGEIEIAKRIEEGIRQMMTALVQNPEMIDTFLKDYDRLIEMQGRISDLITGFF